MRGRCVKRCALLVCLAPALLAGCLPGGSPWALVVPEERHLDLTDPARLPRVPLPDIPAPATVDDPPPADKGRELSLDQAINVALGNSEIVRVLVGVTVTASGRTIYDPTISSTNIDEARAAFDPVASVTNTFNRTETPEPVLAPRTPAGAVIAGLATDAYNLGASVQKKTVTGGTFKVDVTDQVARFQPGVFPLNPQDQSSVGLSFTQPLLKGGGIAPNVAPIVIARINTRISYFQLKDAVQELVRSVVEGYWQLVFARTDVWAKKQQVEQGQGAYDRAVARQRQGLGNLSEVAQSKVALQNFKASLIGSEANLLQREAAMRNLLGLPPAPADRILMTTPPSTLRVEPHWQELIKLAEERRPDIIELKLILEADQQTLLVANNNALPQVDMVTQYRWNGLEGTAPTGIRLATGPGQFTDWTLGVNFAVPLGLRQGRAQLRRAELIIQRDKANLQQGLHSALHTLAGNLRNLAQYHEQYLAYRQTRHAARENLEQQLADFRSGRAIYLNVLQAISDWGNAISSEAQALALYNIELASLERQTGTILDTHGVRFAEERFGSIGPLGRLAPPVLYPASVPPTPNTPYYPVGPVPPDGPITPDPTPPTFPPRPRIGVPTANAQETR
jgi:outer membrane protein TolC